VYDDPRKQGLFVLGVRVVGRVRHLAETVAAYDANQVLLAVPSASRDLVKEVAAQAEAAHVMLRRCSAPQPTGTCHCSRATPVRPSRPTCGGTRNLTELAARYGVKRFMFISTDKAVRPSSTICATKRLGEQLIIGMAPAGTKWTAVRFGNVLGSRGCVIPTFSRQIAQGGPVTVTDASMTRLFMSVQEAVQLVLQAAALAAWWPKSAGRGRSPKAPVLHRIWAWTGDRERQRLRLLTGRLGREQAKREVTTVRAGLPFGTPSRLLARGLARSAL
jgi:nucleoside-diphosphate-sugar epimerase